MTGYDLFDQTMFHLKLLLRDLEHAPDTCTAEECNNVIEMLNQLEKETGDSYQEERDRLRGIALDLKLQRKLHAPGTPIMVTDELMFIRIYGEPKNG